MAISQHRTSVLFTSHLKDGLVVNLYIPHNRQMLLQAGVPMGFYKRITSLEGHILIMFCYLSSSEDLQYKRAILGGSGCIRRVPLYDILLTMFGFLSGQLVYFIFVGFGYFFFVKETLSTTVLLQN